MLLVFKFRDYCFPSWSFHSCLLQVFPPLFQLHFLKTLVFPLHTTIIIKHHLPTCFFSDVFHQWFQYGSPIFYEDAASLCLCVRLSLPPFFDTAVGRYQMGQNLKVTKHQVLKSISGLQLSCSRSHCKYTGWGRVIRGREEWREGGKNGGREGPLPLRLQILW